VVGPEAGLCELGADIPDHSDPANQRVASFLSLTGGIIRQITCFLFFSVVTECNLEIVQK